jgi:hypothetical protein
MIFKAAGNENVNIVVFESDDKTKPEIISRTENKTS